MSDDPLRPAFDALRAATLPAVRPPGVEAARRTVLRRRRTRRAGFGVPAVAAVVAVFAVPLAPVGDDDRPVVPDASTVSTPSETPSGSAGASPTAIATSSTGAQIPGATGSRRVTASPTPTGCRAHGRLVSVLAAPDIFRLELQPTEPRPLCPTESKDFFWATYAGDGFDNWTLFASERYTATASAPLVEGTKRFPQHGGNLCVGYYMVEGRGAVVQTFTNPGDTIGPGPYTGRTIIFGSTTRCDEPPTTV